MMRLLSLLVIDRRCLDREGSAETWARLVSETESKLAVAEGRVAEVEAALSTFRMEAKHTLEAKTSEILAASLAAGDAEGVENDSGSGGSRLKFSSRNTRKTSASTRRSRRKLQSCAALSGMP